MKPKVMKTKAEYEATLYPIDLPDPITALRFRMEQEGLKPKDLVPYRGSKSKVSEVLRGKRHLSLTMIRKLVTGLRFPAEVALLEPSRGRRTKQAAGNRRLHAVGTH